MKKFGRHRFGTTGIFLFSLVVTAKLHQQLALCMLRLCRPNRMVKAVLPWREGRRRRGTRSRSRSEGRTENPRCVGLVPLRIARWEIDAPLPPQYSTGIDASRPYIGRAEGCCLVTENGGNVWRWSWWVRGWLGSGNENLTSHRKERVKMC